MTKVLPEEMKIWSQFIHTICGVSLDASKAYLVENRLGELLQATGCATFSDLYFKAKSDTTGRLGRRIIDAITTGETSFFRDTSPFDLLRHKILPDLIDRRTRGPVRPAQVPIRIWSAACSSGQEVYSTAIVLKELLGDLAGFRIKLLGTDISDQAIAMASRGIYNALEIDRGLPKEKLARYFVPEKDFWKVRDEVRALATFRRINLMEDFTKEVGKFDIVFCRNVAIYFTEQDRIRLFERIARVIEPDGYLVIGSTESLMGVGPQFESKRYLRSVFYQFKAGALAPSA